MSRFKKNVMSLVETWDTAPTRSLHLTVLVPQPKVASAKTSTMNSTSNLYTSCSEQNKFSNGIPYQQDARSPAQAHLRFHPSCLCLHSLLCSPSLTCKGWDRTCAPHQAFSQFEHRFLCDLCNKEGTWQFLTGIYNLNTTPDTHVLQTLLISRHHPASRLALGFTVCV